MLLLNLKDILFVYLCFAYRIVKRIHETTCVEYILLLIEDQSDHVEISQQTRTLYD